MRTITNVTELQNINDDPTQDYILGNNIDASATSTWNDGAGFLPLGSSSRISYSRFWDDTWAYAEGVVGNWIIYPLEGYDPELAWNKVDEVTSDGDATYIQATTAGDYCLLSPALLPLDLPDGATNIVVRIRAVVRNTSSGTSYIQGYLNIDGTYYLVGSNLSVTSQSYATETWTMTEYPPRGVGGWTLSDVSGLSNAGVGVYISDATPDIRITQMWLQVTYDIELTGSFDGKGYTISDLYINRPNESDVGLFGYVDGITIKNVTLTNADITGRNETGSLVGYAQNSTITNCSSSNVYVYGRAYVGGLVGEGYLTDVSDCHSSGTVEGDSPWDYGGLVGAFGYGTVEDCYSSCAVTTLGEEAGGLVGYSWGNPPATIFRRCYATGNIIAREWSGGFVGGEAGYFEDCWAGGNVELTTYGAGGGFMGFGKWGGGYPQFKRCYATGNITGPDSCGGFMGTLYAQYVNTSSIIECFATGNVIPNVEDSWAMGGFVGETWDYALIQDCYSRGKAEGYEAVGGFVGYHDIGANITNCYSTGTATGTIDVGGFCGDNDGVITDSFWDTQTSGTETSGGGIGKTTTQMKRITTFSLADWDIEYTKINRNDRYPFLSWEIDESDTIWKIYSGEGWEEFSFPDLLDDHGRRVKNATINAYSTSTHALVETLTTDENGTAVFSALPVGDDIVFHATWGGLGAPTNEEWFFMRVNDIEDGGTGAGTADQARENLGVNQNAIMWELVFGD